MKEKGNERTSPLCSHLSIHVKKNYVHTQRDTVLKSLWPVDGTLQPIEKRQPRRVPSVLEHEVGDLRP